MNPVQKFIKEQFDAIFGRPRMDNGNTPVQTEWEQGLSIDATKRDIYNPALAELASFIGLALTLDRKGFDDYRAMIADGRVKLKPEGSYADIAVHFEGKARSFTLDEFLLRLGFNDVVTLASADGRQEVAHISGVLSPEEQRIGGDDALKQAIGLLYEAAAMARGEKMSKRGMSPAQLELAITRFLAEHDHRG